MGASGCVVPFVVPPLRSSASAGGAAGQLAPPVMDPDPAAPAPADGEAVTELRGAIHPLQLVDREGSRRWDVGAGYLLQTSPSDTLVDFHRHGPFLEVGYRLWRRPFTDDSSARLTVHGGAELLFANDVVGAGGSFGATLEMVTWASGPFEESSGDGLVVGGAEGETSVGLVALTSYRAVDGTQYWTATMGVSLRSPGLAGLAIFVPKRL